MKKLNKLISQVGLTPPIPGLLLLGTALLGIWHATFSYKWDSGLALWAWGLAVLYPFYARDTAEPSRWQYPQKCSRVVAWALLALSAVLLVTGPKLLILPVLLAAGVFFFGNLKLGIYGAGAILVWTLILPQAEYLQHLISLPMRIMSAGFSSEIMSLIGYDSMAEQTGVNIDGRMIAITAACSGIEQLEAMLICWIISFSMQFRPLASAPAFFHSSADSPFPIRSAWSHAHRHPDRGDIFLQIRFIHLGFGWYCFDSALCRNSTLSQKPIQNKAV